MSNESPSAAANQNTLSDRQREVRPRRLTAEIIGLGAIRQVVDSFYDRARSDAVLGPRFSVVADWPEHKAKLTHFWWVALGGPAYAPYRYRVVEAHRIVGVRSEEITHWLRLFADCVRSTLPEPLAEAWLRRAAAMGESLSLASVGA